MAVYETERLILRPWEDGDASALYEYARDPRIGLSAGWPAHTSIEVSQHIIRTVLIQPESYATVLQATGIPIGSIGLKMGTDSDLIENDTQCELGYWIAVPYWGQGLMPEAGREILRHAFIDLQMHTVWCAYYDGNTQSARVQEKLGFTFHHTSLNTPVPLLGENRTRHVNVLSRDAYAAQMR